MPITAFKVIEILQPLPDNRIRISANSKGKKLEIFTDYKHDKSFSLILKKAEADWLAEVLKEVPSTNWKCLSNEMILRVLEQHEVRQIIVANDGNKTREKEQLGVILVDVLDEVIEGLRSS